MNRPTRPENNTLWKKCKRNLMRLICLKNQKIKEKENSSTTKMIFEFKNRESASIKLFAVKKRTNIKITSRFISGKLLMFAKLAEKFCL